MSAPQMPEGTAVRVVRGSEQYLDREGTVVCEWPRQVAINFPGMGRALFSKAALEVTTEQAQNCCCRPGRVREARLCPDCSRGA